MRHFLAHSLFIFCSLIIFTNLAFANDTLHIQGIDYTVMREIGRGKYGVVFLAHTANEPENLVAIKKTEIEKINSPTPIYQVHAERLEDNMDIHVSLKKILSDLPSVSPSNLIFQPFAIDEISEFKGQMMIRYGVQVMPYADKKLEEQILYLNEEFSMSFKELMKLRMNMAYRVYTDILREINFLSSQKYLHTDIKVEQIVYSTSKKKYGLVDYDSLLVRPTGATQSYQMRLLTDGYDAPEMTSQNFNELGSLYALARSLQTILDPNFRANMKMPPDYLRQIESYWHKSLPESEGTHLPEIFAFIKSALTTNQTLRYRELELNVKNPDLKEILKNIEFVQPQAYPNTPPVHPVKLKKKPAAPSKAKSNHCEALF